MFLLLYIKEYYEDYQVRRYGFHGISHRDAARRAAELLGKSPEELKLIFTRYNANVRVARTQIYVCKGVITEILSSKPQLALMDTGAEGSERLEAPSDGQNNPIDSEEQAGV